MKGKTVFKTKTKARQNHSSAVDPQVVSNERKKLDCLSNFITEIVGAEGLRVAECIGRNGVTDDFIEKTTSMKIAEIRTVLNHLHSYGLVEYTREKNLDTGWFTYTWRLNIDRALQNFISMKHKEYQSMKSKLQASEETQIYKCNKGCACIEFEKALEYTFKCPGCNTKLLAADYGDELKKIEDKIQTLNDIKNLALETPIELKAPEM